MASNLTYHIFDDSKSILCIAPEVFRSQDVKEYFSALLEDKNLPSGMVEHIDMTSTIEFNVNYDAFAPLSALYKGLVEGGKIIRIVFYVSTPLQYGMCRMFSGIMAETNIPFDITYDRSDLDAFYEVLSEDHVAL